MSMVPAEVVAASGWSLPEAHLHPEAMAELALAAARITGFESVGLPLCTTLEAEALGAPVDLGDALTEARITREPYASVLQVRLPPMEALLSGGRVPRVLEAFRYLRDRSGDLPIFLNLLGPASLLASLVEPVVLLKELRTQSQEVEQRLTEITRFLAAFARQAIEAGADAVAVHEDTLTPALLGSKTFARLVAPHLAKLATSVKGAGALGVLHMCGSLGNATRELGALGFDAFIPDHALSLRALGEEIPGIALVGNLNTFLLHQGNPEAIRQAARRLRREGQVQAISPACGMSSATPLGHIRILTEMAGAEA